MEAAKFKWYYNFKIFETIFNPLTGVLMVGESCQIMGYYGQSCYDFLFWDMIWMLSKFFLMFYVAYIAKSVYIRLQRGEVLLVSHGQQILALVNSIQQQSRANANVEMTAVKGVAAGEVIGAGQALDDTNSSEIMNDV